MSLFKQILSICVISYCLLGLVACKSKIESYDEMYCQDIYNKGMNYGLESCHSQASAAFEALESCYPYDNLAVTGQLELIYCNYKSNNFSYAIQLADRFIRIFDMHDNLDYAYYIKGVIGYVKNMSTAFKIFSLDRSMREMHTARLAYNNFKLLLNRFPDSKYAGVSKKYMHNLLFQIANHELGTVNYYINQKAYLAAINRINYIASHLNREAVMAKALAIQVVAYRKLGMIEFANNVLVILKLNFPYSKKLKELLYS